MASVRKNPRSGRWEVRYRSPDGKQRTRGGFTTKSDAKAYRSTLEHTLGRGEWRRPELAKVTVSQWVADYLANSPQKRASTLRRDTAVLHNYLLPSVGALPLAQVTPLDIQRIIDPLVGRLAPGTIRGIYGVISALFRAAVQADMLTTTPCRGVRRPTERPTDKRFLSADELSTLARAIDPDFEAFVFVGGVLGLRFSELAGLRTGDVDFLRRTVAVSRSIAEVGGHLSVEDVKSSSSRRTLQVPEFLIDLLAAHVAATGRVGPDDYLFTAPRGGPLRYSAFHRRTWAPAVRRAGLNGLTIHGLRHTAAGFMIEAGSHPKVIQQRLGHSSITTTLNVYGSVLPSVDDGVTRALDSMFRNRCGAGVVQTGGDTSA